MKLWLVLPAEFVALIVKWYVPVLTVPDRTPVVALIVTPRGTVPDRLNVGAGKPVAVTWKLNETPELKVVELALVMAGGLNTEKFSEFVDADPAMFGSPA